MRVTHTHQHFTAQRQVSWRLELALVAVAAMVLAMGLDMVLARVLALAQAAAAALVLAAVDAGVPAAACRSQGGGEQLPGWRCCDE
jgi:predicted lysophospholipase L1 biosynthesis ABC-type transport system permease subunit